MCDSFMLQKMENYQGDLADVIRSGCTPISGTLGTTTTSTCSSLPPTIHNWQFSQPSDPMAYDNADDFGHPFSNTRDPLLLEELDSIFFTSLNSIDHHQDNSSGFSCGASSNILVAEKNTTNLHIEDQQEDQMKRATTPCNTSNSNCNNNIFSRVLQISPHIISDVKLPISSCKSPVTIRPRIVIKPPPPSPQPSSSISICNDHANNNMIESTGVQISSSPRNTVLKRRKSQLAKKVVCIPAPAPANSRPTGEIVPSDLWAWRKYGQKPIKGSPYPRGYYRCSSSKGCSARKQVERSRTDPNMLVITYTSEHNHPWPTQRNVLAGSTRSTQPTKTINTKAHSPISLSQKGPLPTSNEQQQQQLVLEKDNSNIVDNVSASIDVKEEEMDDYEEKEMIEMDKKINEEELGFPNHDHYQTNYRPEMPNSIISHADQDLFADLEEIEADPLKLMFTQGSAEEERGGNNKAVASLGPFSFYDWAGNSNNNNFTSFGDHAKRGL